FIFIFIFLYIKLNCEMYNIRLAEKETCDKRIQQLQLTIKQLRSYVGELEMEKENLAKKNRQRQLIEKADDPVATSTSLISPTTNSDVAIKKAEEEIPLKDSFIGCFQYKYEYIYIFCNYRFKKKFFSNSFFLFFFF